MEVVFYLTSYSDVLLHGGCILPDIILFWCTFIWRLYSIWHPSYSDVFYLALFYLTSILFWCILHGLILSDIHPILMYFPWFYSIWHRSYSDVLFHGFILSDIHPIQEVCLLTSLQQSHKSWHKWLSNLLEYYLNGNLPLIPDL